MKLSEAIRIGSQRYPQAFGEETKHAAYTRLVQITDQAIGTDAWGAAYVALFGELPELDLSYWTFPLYDRVLSRVDRGAMLQSVPLENPVNGMFCRVAMIVNQLNDKERWTREQIADWLESIGC